MSGEVEIIPPGEPSVRWGEVTVSGQVKRFDRVVMAELPGSPVKSGHWWLFVISRGNAVRGSAPEGYVELMLNGQTLQFPIGVWAVVDDNKFKVAKDSDLPMVWFYGDTLMEKTFEMRERPRGLPPLRVMSEAPVDPRQAQALLARTMGLLAAP